MTGNRVYRNHQERLMMEALDIIGGSRRQAYGPPERNFQRIALIWNGYLSAAFDQPVQLGAHDVCWMLADVKKARLIESPDHEDSMRDLFGYVGCYVDLIYGDDAIDYPAEYQDWPPSEPEVDPPTDEQIVSLGALRAAGADEWHDWLPPSEPDHQVDEQVVDLGALRAAMLENGGRK